jgi:hypothetical protein
MEDARQMAEEAIRCHLESLEDTELLPVIETSRKEWKENGGRPWSDIEAEIEQTIKIT